MNKILDIQKLNISVDNLLSQKKLISDISFNIKKSEVVALIGESGSGKSLTALSIARLLPSGLKINSGKIFLDDENLFSCTEGKMREIRRSKISMIFQEPMNSLNPVMKIYKQINEAIPKVGDNFLEIKIFLFQSGLTIMIEL
jgi:ABC-type dipeptide/oligopeptide/nickel transport system, ATPase component